MGRLAGKVAIITGAGSGMGRAAALRFAREGAKVVVADINEAGGESVAAEIRQAGGESVFVQTDVSKADDCRRMVRAAVESFGQLNVLVNNAGIWSIRQPDQLTEEEWDRMIDINLKGVWLGCKYAIPELRKAGGGAIVNTSSTAGLVGSPTNVAYGAAKFGVVGVTKSIALSLAKENIRVNCICPGNTDTHLFHNDLGPDRAAALREQGHQMTPMGRHGQPEELANAMLFLASDEASYITGAALSVDGGYVTM